MIQSMFLQPIKQKLQRKLTFILERKDNFTKKFPMKTRIIPDTKRELRQMGLKTLRETLTISGDTLTERQKFG